MGYGSCGHRSSDFYPRPPRGGRPLGVLVDDRVQHISIHALREEGDLSGLLQTVGPDDFYPRPPRGGRHGPFSGSRRRGDFYPRPPRGGRRDQGRTIRARKAFLSTPSARRATRLRPRRPQCRPHFYPRPPRGGRQNVLSQSGQRRKISIHALREEGDAKSTWPAVSTRISIHALREEGDLRSRSSRAAPRYFYPRPPRGGRPETCRASVSQKIFLSTPSARRATRDIKPVRTEVLKFLSTPSARRATRLAGKAHHQQAISIHALREEGDHQNIHAPG